jgi:hypothetical protein
MDFDDMVETVNAIIESRVEYETTHKDSGDDYAYLVPESWCSDDESRLIAYMQEKRIDWSGLEIDAIVDQCLERCRMESGHVWSAGNGGFLITSFPVGEIETQIDCDTIGQAFTPELCKALSRASDAYVKYHGDAMALAYIATDSVWDAVVPESRLRKIVAELRSECVAA